MFYDKVYVKDRTDNDLLNIQIWNTINPSIYLCDENQ